ncbi:MAG: hypothetical protein QXH27_06025, partial [Candidatus Micrarchaeia archaeon]
EAKKGNLRMIMSFVKTAGLGLGVHGSSKTIVVTDRKTGQMTMIGVALIGLSGTGKPRSVDPTTGCGFLKGCSAIRMTL